MNRPLEPPVEDPMIGQTVGGRYLVEAPIGDGAMGKVYRARHSAIGRRLAIKFMHAKHTPATPATQHSTTQQPDPA